MPADHQRFIVMEEKSQQQVADVKPVHIGIGGQYDAVVTKAFQRVFDAQGFHDIVEFQILIECILPHAPTVERLALEAEDRLGQDVS